MFFFKTAKGAETFIIRKSDLLLSLITDQGNEDLRKQLQALTFPPKEGGLADLRLSCFSFCKRLPVFTG